MVNEPNTASEGAAPAAERAVPASEPPRGRWWSWSWTTALAERPILSLALIAVALSLLFRLWPQLDLWFSAAFYDAEIGFPASRIPIAEWLREAARTVTWTIVAVLVLTVIVKLVLPRQPSPIAPRATVFLLSTLAIGPGLLINGILKEVSGRPRPIAVTDFGGDQPYVPVWQFTDLCTDNCSFAAGEASSAVWLVGLALVAPGRWRRPVMVVTLALALILSLNRIAFGGHFLSDVALAWALTLLVMAIAYRFLYVVPPRFLTDEALEGLLTRIGLGIRRSVERGAKVIGPAPIPPDRYRAQRGPVRREGEQPENEGQRGEQSDGHP